MKKNIKQVPALLLAIIMCVSVMAISVGAVVYASYYIDNVDAHVSASSRGKILIAASVDGTRIMSKIGATQIKVQESTDGGKTYTTVETYSYKDYPEMMWYDELYYDDTPITYQGTVGYRYRAIVTLYAGDSTGGDSRAYTTNSVVATR